MDLIFNQLGTLLLGALPTSALFILLVVAYRVLVHGPLIKTLAERRARTEGAVEQAQEAIVAAETKTRVYEDTLRSARAEVFKARESRIQQLNQAREIALEEARNVAHGTVEAAKVTIATQTVEARKTIQAQAADLAQKVLAAVLPGGLSRQGSVQ
jgi:F-type H+-transporting ATPase subunit b